MIHYAFSAFLFSYPSTAFMKAFSFTFSTPRFVSSPCSHVPPSFSKFPSPLCLDVKIQILFFFSFYLHSHLAINILTAILSNGKPLTFHCGIFCILLFFTLSYGSCKSHPENPLIILSVWTCLLHTHSQRWAMLIHLPSTFSPLLLFFIFSLPLGFN